QLSIEAGMSISKLQKCFPQVFGKSISQYALSEKMNLARQKLDTKKYSVSEVGYQIGYSNLSHFSIAFKNEFGVNPKSYLHNL
ncbi:MAG: helix-turn-helix transcriptional regulator, partial [Massilibacteroides sp.]|nr:helix-turn-helix transcriptional regulator [Massilibacteroides sp.]